MHRWLSLPLGSGWAGIWFLRANFATKVSLMPRNSAATLAVVKTPNAEHVILITEHTRPRS